MSSPPSREREPSSTCCCPLHHHHHPRPADDDGDQEPAPSRWRHHCCCCCHRGASQRRRRTRSIHPRRFLLLSTTLMLLHSSSIRRASMLRSCHAFQHMMVLKGSIKQRRPTLSIPLSEIPSRGNVPCFRKCSRASSRTTCRLLASSKTTAALQQDPLDQEDKADDDDDDDEYFCAGAAPNVLVANQNGYVSHNNGNDDDDDDSAMIIRQLTETWRENPVCNPTVHFQSWVLSDGKAVQTILSNELTQPYLASRLELLDKLHHRIKLVRDMDPDGRDDNFNNSRQQKMILLHPDTPPIAKLPKAVRDFLSSLPSSSSDDDKNNNSSSVLTEGPVIPMSFSYHQFTAAHLLEQLLPESVHPPPAAFETAGHVAHLNLRSRHVPYRHLIGQVLLETLPAIETVIHKVGQVQGPYRTFEMEVVAGRPDTAVHLQESGVRLEFDLARVYWCSRLSQERKRLLKEEIFASRNNNNSLVLADPFCGVGALCLQAAKEANADGTEVEVWANDWNPQAVQALRDNAAANGLSDCLTQLQCGDAYDFLMDLGLMSSTRTSTPTTASTIKNSRNNSSSDDTRLPDHVVMNFPLKAPEFLGALRWWPAGSGAEPRVHVYTFARADDGNNLEAQDVAVNLVADNLLPSLPGDRKEATKRMEELNDEYGCKVQVHLVRDVAPGKMVFCVSFTVTDKLLRCMQGEF